MDEVIRGSWPGENSPNKGDAAMDDWIESGKHLSLRAAALRELQRQQDQPEADDAMIRDLSRRQLRQGHPDWDEAVLAEIAEDMAGVYQVLLEVCRSRLRQARPHFDAVEVQMTMMEIAHPPHSVGGKGTPPEDAPAARGAGAASCGDYG